MTKREFLAASAGAGLALAKAGPAFAQQAAAAAPRTAAENPVAHGENHQAVQEPAGNAKRNCRGAGRLVDRGTKGIGQGCR